jgi:hypothetical protein
MRLTVVLRHVLFVIIIVTKVKLDKGFLVSMNSVVEE